MLNYNSPTVQFTLQNAGYYNNQPQVNLNIGQQGYNNYVHNPFYDSIPQSYQQGYTYYNPMIMQKEQEEILKQQRKKISDLRKFERKLHLNHLIYRGIEITDEIEKQLDDLYLPEWERKTETKEMRRPKIFRLSEQVTVVAYRGDEEVYNSKQEKRILDVGPNYEDERRGYAYYGNPYIGKSIVQRILDAKKRQEMYPNGEPALIAAWNKIREENDKLVDPSCNMIEFFENASKLYIDGIKRKGEKFEKQLNKLYDTKKFHNTLYSGSINLDDQVIGLPDKLKTDYMARKKAFIAAAMRRGGEADG